MTVFVRVAAPLSTLVPVMTIGYVPVGTAAVVANVSVAAAPVFDGASAAGALSVMPDGRPVAVNPTFDAYPESDARVSLTVPVLPCAMVMEFVDAVIVKSRMTSDTVVVCVRVPSVAEMVMVYVPAGALVGTVMVVPETVVPVGAPDTEIVGEPL